MIAAGFEESFPAENYSSRLPSKASNETIFFGASLSALQGLLTMYRWDGGPEIGALVTLPELQGREPRLCDGSGLKVDLSNIEDYPGYRDYNCKSPVASIEIIDSYFHGAGNGSAALRFLMSRGYGLIDAEAYDKDAVNFFKKNGFIESGLNSSTGKVMVWTKL